MRPGSRARLQTTQRPKDLKDREGEIDTVTHEKESSISAQEYEKAAKLRDKEKEMRRALDEARKSWREKRDATVPVVNAEDIAAVVSKWTGIPTMKLTETEQAKLVHMDDELHKRVIGQEEAIKAISQSIRRSRTGIERSQETRGQFYFPRAHRRGQNRIGAGLAEFLFGNEESLVRIDMSEYMEKFSVSRLIGAPPGYVGYEEGGQLTEAVRRKPYSVVLLDEIEKAHPDTFNILLQMMDDGALSDNLGHRVSFKNTVIIMTSNVGARLISKGKSLGFLLQEDAAKDYSSMKDTVMEEVKKAFNPEFLNRLDDIIVFHPLTREESRKILDLHVGAGVQENFEPGIDGQFDGRSQELPCGKGVRSPLRGAAVADGPFNGCWKIPWRKIFFPKRFPPARRFLSGWTPRPESSSFPPLRPRRS
jgi:ATP-dependent Clp protease ATP-binding subunit ClpC